MAKPGKIKEIEAREGQPIVTVLKAMYKKHGKQKKVAEALGVNQTTVSLWLMRLGYVERTVIVPRGSVNSEK